MGIGDQGNAVGGDQYHTDDNDDEDDLYYTQTLPDPRKIEDGNLNHRKGQSEKRVGVGQEVAQ